LEEEAFVIDLCSISTLEEGFLFQDVQWRGEIYSKLYLFPEGLFMIADVGMAPKKILEQFFASCFQKHVYIYIIPEKGFYSSNLLKRLDIKDFEVEAIANYRNKSAVCLTAKDLDDIVFFHQANGCPESWLSV